MDTNGQPEEISTSTDEELDVSHASESPKPLPIGPGREQSGLTWKEVALLGGVIAGVAVVAVVVTLAATHNSAVTENAKAYVNGFSDGLRAAFPENANAYRSGFADALDALGIDHPEVDWFE